MQSAAILHNAALIRSKRAQRRLRHPLSDFPPLVDKSRGA